MLVTKEVWAALKGPYIHRYEAKGYDIPRSKRQKYYINADGIRRKNGTTLSTQDRKILVKVEDLPPTSHYPITYICDKCGKEQTTSYSMYRRCKKDKDICVKCTRTKDNATAHETWVKKLIANNPFAKCDICGEIDKRFLVLHHIEGRGDDKNNERKGYVILSANYHVAFHKYLGSTRVRSTREKYEEFKKQEQQVLERGIDYGMESCGSQSVGIARCAA